MELELQEALEKNIVQWMNKYLNNKRVWGKGSLYVQAPPRI